MAGQLDTPSSDISAKSEQE
ncbi:Putative uncharacterized protein [Lactococcus lactis subsp. lactis A12]|uniref:Uncharacterized protein n=1 Tax=Lactococcus lactis subsp. lactis A12 TaxID=1137134 RepID=S6EU45_LACLL|nr:Putative uncharacterized protein [Lactococcus lactis subsp. lactis A12]SBW30914.1 Hypothetical protein LLA12_01764 [Lactococcus lactis subsp. lactis]